MTEQLIVTVEWLHQHLDDANLRIVDIRGHVLPASEPPPHYFNHHADYVKSHIPGATFVDWVQEITDPADPRHAQIARPDRFAEAMSRHGIGDSTFVVAYDDAGGMFAARLWWALNYYGHAQVAVLDGGWQAWTAQEKPVTADLPAITPAHFTPSSNGRIYRDKHAVLSHLDDHQMLIDVRSPDEYAGKTSRAVKKGHIPGAINLPRTTLVAPDGTFLSAAELREKFRSAGADSHEDVVFYCNGGVSASFGLLTYRLAGFQGGAVYDGSWKDWGNDEQTPIE